MPLDGPILPDKADCLEVGPGLGGAFAAQSPLSALKVVRCCAQ